MRLYKSIHGPEVVRAAKIQDPATLVTTTMLADGAHGRTKPRAGDYLLTTPGRERRVAAGVWFENNFDLVTEPDKGKK